MKAFVWRWGSAWWREQRHLENGSGCVHRFSCIHLKKRLLRNAIVLFTNRVVSRLSSKFKLIAAFSGSLMSHVVGKRCIWKCWIIPSLAGKVFCCLWMWGFGSLPKLLGNLPFFKHEDEDIDLLVVQRKCVVCVANTGCGFPLFKFRHESPSFV